MDAHPRTDYRGQYPSRWRIARRIRSQARLLGSKRADLLVEFFTYTEPDIASFESAVQEFKERVPELAQALLGIIEREYKQNKKFIAAFNTFTELCRQSLDPKIGIDVIQEMLIQHLLTERLFSTVF